MHCIADMRDSELGSKEVEWKTKRAKGGVVGRSNLLGTIYTNDGEAVRRSWYANDENEEGELTVGEGRVAVGADGHVFEGLSRVQIFVSGADPRAQSADLKKMPCVTRR